MLGPARSLAAMFYGPLKAVPGWDLETLVLAALALIGFGAAVLAAQRTNAHRNGASAPGGGAAGLAMLVLGYGLAFTHFPPNAIVGRGTSVHLGATLGMSVLAASVAWLLLGIRPRVATALLAAYLALAVGYYVTIERDFMRSWQLQRGFWQQVVACCSDLQDGTVLLYELNATDEPTTFIFTNSWADPLVLGETFAFPPAWANPPRLFSLTQWLDRVQPEGDHLRWWVPGASWDEHWEVLPQGNVILLRRAPDGGLTRVTGTVLVAGPDAPAEGPRPPTSPGRRRSCTTRSAVSAATPMDPFRYAALATRTIAEFNEDRVFDPTLACAHAPVARADGDAVAPRTRRRAGAWPAADDLGSRRRRRHRPAPGAAGRP